MADDKGVSPENVPAPPDFGEDYDEAPNATEADADFDAPEQNAKEVSK